MRARGPASSALFLNNKRLVWQLHNLGTAYRTRPSEIVGVRNSWAAYQFDATVMIFGRWVENRIREGENVLALLHDDYGKAPGRTGDKGPADTADGRFRSVLGLRKGYDSSCDSPAADPLS